MERDNRPTINQPGLHTSKVTPEKRGCLPRIIHALAKTVTVVKNTATEVRETFSDDHVSGAGHN